MEIISGEINPLGHPTKPKYGNPKGTMFKMLDIVY